MMRRSGARLGPSRNGSAKMSSLPPPPDWPGASGPSKQATIWLAASGRQPWATGTRPVRPNIAAARRAVTSPKGPSPRTIGVDSASSVARILAGLTNDSDDGRASVAVRSRRSASSANVSWLTEAMPRASAASSAGVACAHTDVRDEDPLDGDRDVHAVGAGADVGERGVRGADRDEERAPPRGLGGEGERAGRAAGLRHRDDDVEGTHPPRQRAGRAALDREGCRAARDGLEEVGHGDRATGRRDDDTAWLDVTQPVETGLAGGGHRAPHLGAGPGEGAERVAGVEGRQGALVVEAGFVEHGAHGLSRRCVGRGRRGGRERRPRRGTRGGRCRSAAR